MENVTGTIHYKIKMAEQAWELEAVCRLNHQTFSEEFEQHQKNESGLLVDKFHDENKYIICIHQSEVIGMVALRDVRPFSLDYKLSDLDQYLPPHNSLCEIRLLSVKPQYRSSSVFYHLFKEAFKQFKKCGYDYGLISGILSQQKLYKSIGFVPFGPEVGDKVRFQPMYATADLFFSSRHSEVLTKQKRVNLLPGPVDLKPAVAKEFHRISESHRSNLFTDEFARINTSLCSLVKAKNVQLLTGSATLANEVMIAHLSALSKKGLILSNGEFGDRLISQAKGQKLKFKTYRIELGEEYDIVDIKRVLDTNKDIEWVLFVHSETSSGILNDMESITQLCDERKLLTVADCVSSYGIVPLDLSKVYMASASSGKAIGSFAGLGIVYYNNLLPVQENSIPVYLDLWHYINKSGIPFTINSNAVRALGVAVKDINVNEKFNEALTNSIWLRKQFENLNLQTVKAQAMHPAIITLQLPASVSSVILGKQLADKNILLSYNSAYLVKKNRIQICLFSQVSTQELEYFILVLRQSLMSRSIQ